MAGIVEPRPRHMWVLPDEGGLTNVLQHLKDVSDMEGYWIEDMKYGWDKYELNVYEPGKNPWVRIAELPI